MIVYSLVYNRVYIAIMEDLHYHKVSIKKPKFKLYATVTVLAPAWQRDGKVMARRFDIDLKDWYYEIEFDVLDKQVFPESVIVVSQ